MKKTIEILVRAFIVFAITVTITAGAMALVGAEQHSSCEAIEQAQRP